MIGLIKGALEFLVDRVGRWILWFSPLAALLYYSDDIFEALNAGLDDVHTTLQSVLAVGTGGISGLMSYLQVANTFFPVTEAFVYLGLWIVLRVTCVIVRLIKGATPTLG